MERPAREVGNIAHNLPTFTSFTKYKLVAQNLKGRNEIIFEAHLNKVGIYAADVTRRVQPNACRLNFDKCIAESKVANWIVATTVATFDSAMCVSSIKNAAVMQKCPPKCA